MYLASERVGTCAANTILRGDCLQACAYLKERGLHPDLVYIDPPFASAKAYKKPIYLRPLPGQPRPAQAKLAPAWQQTIFQDNRQPEDFLAWMRPNLQAIYDVLSSSGVLFVHLDHHISHYVKVMLDEIFGRDNFRNEIIWSYKTGGTSKRTFAQKHDTIFFYSKSSKYVFNPQFYRSYQAKRYNYNPNYPELWDEEAQRWYHLAVCRDVWEDIKVIGTERDGSERLDYPTQKPLALLQRIIAAASHEGQLIADFFGGSGVCAAAAHSLGRHFFHSDCSAQSIITCRGRLLQAGAEFTVYQPYDSTICSYSSSDSQLDLHSNSQSDSPSSEAERISSASNISQNSISPGPTSQAPLAQDAQLDCTLLPQSSGSWLISINAYRAPRLEKTIGELNAKAQRSSAAAKQKKILAYSESELEFLEWLSVDCQSGEGCWHSDSELYIDAYGQARHNGDQLFVWDGKLYSPSRPLRLKVRDIAGQETIIKL